MSSRSGSQKRKRYKLPNTGVIVEINEPSAYEFITEKLPLVNDLYKRYKPEGDASSFDQNDPLMVEFDYLAGIALFVTAMTIVIEENGQKKEYRFSNWEDMEKIIDTALDLEDSNILLKLIEKSRALVSPISFRIENVNCPMCGRHEDFIPIDDIGSSLIFQLSRRLKDTQINLIEMDSN